MKIKYVRCSTINQNLDRQLADKENYDLIFEEKSAANLKITEQNCRICLNPFVLAMKFFAIVLID